MKTTPAVVLSSTAVFLIALAGCGGGGGGTAGGPATVLPPAKQGFVTKAVRIVIPGKKNQAKHAKYVSTSSQGVGVSYGPSPFTFPSQSTPTAAFDISGNSSLCQTDTQTGGRTCTVTVQATVGTSYDFQITVWDTTPSNNGFTAGNILSTVTVLGQTIASGSAPAISASLNGVVTAFNATVSPTSLAASQTGGATATVSVNALDSDGNVVMGSGGWVDASGNPLTVTLTSAATTSGGPIKTTPASPAPVTATSPDVTVTYRGGSSWGTVFTPAVSESGTFGGSVSGATLAITPTVTLIPIPLPASSGTPPSPQPWHIAGATDGNVYFTESATQQLARVNVAQGSITQISDGGNNANPTGITQASDGNIWSVMYNPGNVGNYFSVPDGGNFTAANVGNSSFGAKFGSLNPFGDQQDIVDGGDGCMYISEPGYADIYGTSLTSTTCPTGTFPGSNTPVGLVKGPDGNIWYADSSGTIGYFSIPGHAITQKAAIAGGNPSFIAVGSDGNIWFTVPNGDYVQSITPGGTLSAQYPVPPAIGALAGIVAGTDGALWVAGGGGGIARVTTAGVVTTFTTGLTASDDPFAVCLGPDGNIWFTETNASKIGVLIY